MEYYSVTSKKEILPLAETWVHLEIIILSDIKNKYDITYMWNKKMTQVNLFTKQEQIHRLWKQTYGYQREKVGGGIN